MQNYIKRAAQLISNLCLTNSKKPSVITPTHTKSEISGQETPYFRRVRPASVGVSPLLLASLIEELEAEQRANVQNIMVIKDGVCILEASAPGFDTNTYRLSHSMSKTVTGLAIGFLVEERGLDLDAKVCDIFPEYKYEDKRFPEMTIEHLLSMRSGVPFSELGTVTESEWTKTFIGSELSFAPGEKFHYNSMNSYVLAKIAEKLSAESLTDFLLPRLFTPLGISNFHWELSPEGVEKGGFGLYLSTESWAKIGELFLGVGEFRGKRLISRSWILRMITERSIAPESTGAFNYGYHIWTSRTSDDFLLNGMLGQNVWVCPKNNLVAVINCANSELFQESAALTAVRRYLGGELYAKPTRKDSLFLRDKVAHFYESRHKIRPKLPLRGLTYALRLRSATPFDTAWDKMLGEYVFPDNNSGLLPVFVSVMQNNFGGGIEKMEFIRDGSSLIFACTEGGIRREIEVGFYGFKTCTLTYGGETYIVNAICEAMEDEDRNPIFKLELVFPELPNTRLIKFSFDKGRLTVRMSESPDQRIIETYLGDLLANGKSGIAMSILERKLGEDFISKKLSELFYPTLSAISTSTVGWESILLEENLLAREVAARTGGMLSGLITKFLGTDEPEPKKEKSGGIRSWLSRRKANKEAKAQEQSYDIVIEDSVSTDTVDTDEAPAALPPHDSTEP